MSKKIMLQFFSRRFCSRTANLSGVRECLARERGGEGRGIADDSQHSAPLHPHWDPDVTTAADRKRSEVGEGGGGGRGLGGGGAAGVGNKLYFAVGIVLLLCQ